MPNQDTSTWGIPDWLGSFGKPGDPMAGSAWEDVDGTASRIPFTNVGTGPDSNDPGNWAGTGPDSNDPYNWAGTGPDSNDPGSRRSLIEQLLRGRVSNGLDQAGTLLQGFGNDELMNRLLRGSLTQNYDRLMMDAEKGRNDTESDALKKLAHTSYLGSGGSQFKPPTISLGGRSRTAPDLGFGPKPASEAQKTGAANLEGQLTSRLAPGGTYTPTPLDSYAQPGTAENIGRYGSLAAGGLGILDRFLGGQSGGDSGSMSGGGGGIGNTIAQGAGIAGMIGGLGKNVAGQVGTNATGAAGAAGTIGGMLGKVVPYAGLASGIYGLGKNQGTISNIASGAGAGASLGSIVPGLGTAVGAGVGAIVGGVRSLFNIGKPSAQELQGRTARQYARDQIIAKATPQQTQEAQSAGWQDSREALGLIVLRDTLIKSGMNPQEADQKAQQVYKALGESEHGGAQSVASAYSPIQSIMSQRRA